MKKLFHLMFLSLIMSISLNADVYGYKGSASVSIKKVQYYRTHFDYNKGFKLYRKYIKKELNLKGTEFLKYLNIKGPKDVLYLFIINKNKLKEMAKNDEKIKTLLEIISKFKKEHYNNFVSFLIGLSYGQIPAGC